MKVVIQRVKSASVSVDGNVVGEIDKGLFVLVGVSCEDTREDAEYVAKKLIGFRLMADKDMKMNKTVSDVNGGFLIVSQFTLIADTKKGNRPSFIKSAKPELAKEYYEYLIDLIKRSGVNVQTGSFGEYMDIEAMLDGPVTIVLDSKNK